MKLSKEIKIQIKNEIIKREKSKSAVRAMLAETETLLRNKIMETLKKFPIPEDCPFRESFLMQENHSVIVRKDSHRYTSMHMELKNKKGYYIFPYNEPLSDKNFPIAKNEINNIIEYGRLIEEEDSALETLYSCILEYRTSEELLADFKKFSNIIKGYISL